MDAKHQKVKIKTLEDNFHLPDWTKWDAGKAEGGAIHIPLAGVEISVIFGQQPKMSNVYFLWFRHSVSRVLLSNLRNGARESYLQLYFTRWINWNLVRFPLLNTTRMHYKCTAIASETQNVRKESHTITSLCIIVMPSIFKIISTTP